MGRGSSDAISAPPPPTPTAADATVSGSGSTSASSRATTLVERQIIITINITDPAATISALSSSLAVAQRSVTLLANEVQQVQLASVRAVASAQSAAAASALSTVASVSSSAALALASASTLVSNAGAAAVAASRSADAAIANASSIQVGDFPGRCGGLFESSKRALRLTSICRRKPTSVDDSTPTASQRHN